MDRPISPIFWHIVEVIPELLSMTFQNICFISLEVIKDLIETKLLTLCMGGTRRSGPI